MSNYDPSSSEMFDLASIPRVPLSTLVVWQVGGIGCVIIALALIAASTALIWKFFDALTYADWWCDLWWGQKALKKQSSSDAQNVLDEERQKLNPFEPASKSDTIDSDKYAPNFFYGRKPS